MLHYLWVAIIGLVVGALAKLIMPGKDPGGGSSPCCWASLALFWEGGLVTVFFIGTSKAALDGS